MSKFELNSENFNAVVVDLLIDIVAYNKDILEKINSIYPNSSSEEENVDNRVLVLEYLQSKYGEMPKELLDFLKTKNINKNDK
ncbi:hypothetical protein [Flavobacterium sp. WC2429]|uniref:Uncharacterized protein n=1 Tax=Flavobacterium sp. WC2429 TaxID=3234140 RepID=A0AB39WHS8_9FLAO